MEDSTPARSSRNSSESPSQPGKVKWALPGSRPWTGRPAQHGVGHRCQDAVDQPVPEGGNAFAASSGSLVVTASAAAAKAAMDAVSRVPERTSRSCPPPCWTGVSFTARPEHQRADADRAADLVPGNGHGVQPGGPEIHGYRAEGLDGIGVDRNAGPVRQFDDLRNGLDAADFVVGPHHRDQGDRGRVPGELGGQHGQVHDAVRIHRQPRHFGALVPLQPFDGVQHGVVFDGGAQDARAGGVLGVPGPVQALHGKVVGFGSARGEDDFGGVRPGSGSQHLAGVLDGAAGAAARSVQRGGVAGPGQFTGQRRQGLRGQGGGCGMIKVYGHRAILPAGPPLHWCTFER